MASGCPARSFSAYTAPSRGEVTRMQLIGVLPAEVGQNPNVRLSQLDTPGDGSYKIT